MSMYRRLVFAAAALGAAATGAAASAAAAEPFGQHVSGCAQVSLGQPPDTPAVTCSHDGMTMTFDTFGEMVLHMPANAGRRSASAELHEIRTTPRHRLRRPAGGLAHTQETNSARPATTTAQAT